MTQGTRITTAGTIAAPTRHLMAVVSTAVEAEMPVAGTEEDIDDDPSA